MELDKPILMHDKMEIIWEKSAQREFEVQMKLNKNLDQNEFNFNQKRKSENQDHSVNRFLVKQNLDKLKLNRLSGNKRIIKAYNRMLQYVDEREIVFTSGNKRPEKINMHEKEKELFDAMRLIIQNGYELGEQDIVDILKFIQI